MAKKQQSRERGLRRGDGYITVRTLADGSLRWQARWHDGTRPRTKTFRDEDAAEDHLRDAGRRRRRQEFVPDEEYTLTDVVDDYIERARSRLKPNTIWSYQWLKKTFIDPDPIGTVIVTDLKPRMLQNWIDRLSRELAPASVETVRALTTGALNEAVRLEVIPRNPLNGVKMPKKKPRPLSYWSRDEVTRVLETVQDDVFMHTFYTVAISTGMRPGELLALSWTNVNFDAEYLMCMTTLTRSETGQTVIGEQTKTGENRRIKIPKPTITALRAYRRHQAERRLAHKAWHDFDLVFDRGNGTALQANTLRNRHRKAAKAAGVPILRLHDLRHTAATLLIEQGVDFKTISQMLGHKTVAMTIDIYGHVTPNMESRAADVMGEILDSGVRELRGN